MVKPEVLNNDFSPCTGCNLNFRELWRISDDNSKLFRYLVEHHVILDSYTCVNCRNPCFIDFSKLKWYCRRSRLTTSPKRLKKRKKVQCHMNFSVNYNSFFARCHFTLGKALFFVQLWLTLPSPKQVILEEQVGLSRSTVVNWSSYCREVCVHWVDTNSVKLGGKGTIVEIGEAQFGGSFGKREYCGGTARQGEWVFVGYERGTKKVFLVPVSDRTPQCLLAVVSEWVFPQTTIVSDCWKTYDCHARKDFKIVKAKNSLKFVDPEPFVRSGPKTTCKNVRSLATTGRREGRLVGYFAEYQFKEAFAPSERMHHFLISASVLYNPKADRPPGSDKEASLDLDNCTESSFKLFPISSPSA